MVLNKIQMEAVMKKDVKEIMIQSTIELIKEYGDFNKITIRDIASKSNVGVGLINYHFQTKENLIDFCIFKLIREFITGLEVNVKKQTLSPVEQLRFVFIEICQFLVDNTEVSKLGMLLDLNAQNLDDNTDIATNMYFNILKEILKDKSDQEIHLQLHMLMASLQFAFLRSDLFKKNTGIDFYDEQDRKQLIVNLIERIIISRKIRRV